MDKQGHTSTEETLRVRPIEVVIRFSLDSGGRPVGYLRERHGAGSPTSFVGWLALMGILSDAAGSVAEPLGPESEKASP